MNTPYAPCQGDTQARCEMNTPYAPCQGDTQARFEMNTPYAPCHVLLDGTGSARYTWVVGIAGQ